MGLIIAESFRRFFELNSSKSKIAKILIEDVHTTTEFANYIARRGDMISFLPAGKEHMVNPDTGDWKRENRQTARAGKLARKLIDSNYVEELELKDTDYELFSNLIKADKINDEDCAVRFITVKGENIRYRYHEENHSNLYSTGTMGESCMRYSQCQKYLELYVKNPDQINLLVMVDNENKTVGRAIIWQTNEGVFMDRVYATDAHQKMFENYAESKGWLYKSEHTNDPAVDIVKDGEEIYMTIVVKLNESEFDYYPYMDTLCYLNYSGKISNNTDYNDKELRCTDGTVEGQNDEDDHDGEVWDEENEEWIDENYATYISGYGHVHEDNAVYDDYADEYIRIRNAQKLENGKWCHEDDATDTNDGWVHDSELDNYKKIDGEWYHRENDCVLDELTNEYILYNDSVELYEGGRTHENNRSIVLLDESYGKNQYAKSSDCFECPHSNTWFLTSDGKTLYSGTTVSNMYLDEYLKDNEHEITIADNQLELEING